VTAARRGDRGSAGLLAVAAAAVVLAATVVALTWGSAVTARHRAARSADLAALAAAQAAAAGLPDPCAAAGRVAAASRATVTSCDVLADGSVLVVVAVPLLASTATTAGLLDAHVSPARGRARAGAP
jgi:secretion/DNA translocation related TadE-like protein